ncbi:MAG: hypothetical protein J6T34_03855, partial [Bacilli bacterium]|nr:hypothetical protein [Bacilli bacterium]
MPFDINVFANRLKELFVGSPLFPNMPENYINEWGVVQSDRSKHKGREPLKLKDVVISSMANSTIFAENEVSFNIGNEQMEKTHPYYHILEQAPVIRKRGKGTDKTRGSQAKVEDMGQRDYERVTFNGKTFTKEYSRNVRGKRNRTDNATHFISDSRGNRKMVNREAGAYQNVHYMYIERILDSGILNT